MLIPVTSPPSALLSWSPRHCSGTGQCRGFGCGAGIRWSSRGGRSARIGRSRSPGGGWSTRTTWCTCATDHHRQDICHTITQPEFPVGIVTPTIRNAIGSKGTGVTCAGSNVVNDQPCGRQRQHWGEAINRSTVTNLPVILSPTVGDTTTRQCTGMTPAGANGVKRDPRGHCH